MVCEKRESVNAAQMQDYEQLLTFSIISAKIPLVIVEYDLNVALRVKELYLAKRKPCTQTAHATRHNSSRIRSDIRYYYQLYNLN